MGPGFKVIKKTILSYVKIKVSLICTTCILTCVKMKNYLKDKTSFMSCKQQQWKNKSHLRYVVNQVL